MKAGRRTELFFQPETRRPPHCEGNVIGSPVKVSLCNPSEQKQLSAKLASLKIKSPKTSSANKTSTSKQIWKGHPVNHCNVAG